LSFDISIIREYFLCIFFANLVLLISSYVGTIQQLITMTYADNAIFSKHDVEFAWNGRNWEFQKRLWHKIYDWYQQTDANARQIGSNQHHLRFLHATTWSSKRLKDAKSW